MSQSDYVCCQIYQARSGKIAIYRPGSPYIVWTIQDDLGRSRTIRDDPGRSRTIPDDPGRSGTIRDDPGRSGTIPDDPWRSRTIYLVGGTFWSSTKEWRSQFFSYLTVLFFVSCVQQLHGRLSGLDKLDLMCLSEIQNCFSHLYR